MDHVSAELSARFARSCTTAAFGYARAASAAYAALANQTLDFWAQAAGSARQHDDDRSSALGFMTGPRPYRSAFAAPSTEMAMPLDLVRISNAWVASPMFAPIRAWWNLFPLQGNPASWPMAYAMMTAGVPRAVALPAAEANVAAMDAAEAASSSIDHMLSSYRSESGFAVAQVVVSSKALMSAMFLAPLTMSVRLPWA